jgi:broad specificity phosphatase PhoE
VASLLAGKDVGAVYSSDLRRARRTADVIAEHIGCEVRTDSRLRERSFGVLEGMPLAELPPEVTGICRGRIADVDAHAAGGESLGDLAARCTDFVTWLEAEEDGCDLVVVAHGDSVRLLRAAIAGIDPSGMGWGSVANASIHRLVLPSAHPVPESTRTANQLVPRSVDTRRWATPLGSMIHSPAARVTDAPPTSRTAPPARVMTHSS